MLEQLLTTNTINTGIKLISILAQKAEKYQKISEEEAAFLRMLYLEVVNNLEVFQAIDIDKFQDAKVTDEEVKLLLELLHTEMLEGVFYIEPKEDSNLYKTLKKSGRFKETSAEGTNKNTESIAQNRYESVLQAISFVVVKINLLKKCSQLNEDQLSILKKLRLKTRLSNIEQRLVMVKKKLAENKDIKYMHR